MKKNLFLLLVILLVIPGILFAGTTGKIKGKVKLKDNGEPAIGASVLIDGTTMGSSTDLQGQYLILNVPAGVYTLKFSFVGYHAVSVTNVKVSADLTTELNFDMVSQDVELPTVTIVAERPMVNKSATNAVRILNTDDLQAIPVRGLAGVFALQPGVVLQDNNIYIRGGRPDEVGYYVEGANTRDVVTGRNAVTLIPEALEEFQIQAGGYNAEYGGANAGIVRQQLRSGLSSWKATFQVESDQLNSQYSNSFLKTNSYGYMNDVLTLSGPLYQDKIKFFFAGEYQFQRDRTPTFWNNGLEFPNAAFPAPLVDGAGGGIPGDTLFAVNGIPSASVGNSKYGALVVKPGNIASNFQNRYTANGTLTFDFNPYIVRLGAAVSMQRRQINPLPVITTLDGARLPLDDNSNGLYNMKFTHLLTPKTFYEVNVNYYDSRRKRYDPNLVDNLMAYGDSIENAKYGYQYAGYGEGVLSPRDYRFYGFPYARYGQLITSGLRDGGAVQDAGGLRYLKQKQSYMGGSLDFTSQTGMHEIKFGGSYQRYTVRNYSVGTLENVFLNFFSRPDAARDPAQADQIMRSQGLPDNYGYDLYGNETSSGLYGPKHPIFFATYVQDKIEYRDLIINFGLRYDRFYTDDREFIDPADPKFLNNDVFNIDPASLKKKDPFEALTPRLGLGFPVTDRTVFHLQYGKFIQTPQLGNIYLGAPQVALYVSGRNFIPAPVGFGLDPERTTQYEIGFTQQLTDFVSFDLTGFYKDIKGQIQAAKIVTSSSSQAKSYNVLQNGDFATTKGLEFALTMRRIERIQAKLNYTLSDAQGTGSIPNGAVGGVEQGTLIPTLITPLTFNQTHRGTINLDYHWGKNDGGSILERLGMNLLFTFSSGHNYTLVTGGIGQTGPEDGGILYDGDPRNRQPLEALNSSTTPWNFSFDIRVDKTVNISNLFDANIYVYVQNLFNTENVINVYGRTGSAYDDGFLTNPDLSNSIINAPGRGDAYVAMYQDVNLGLRQNYWKNQGGDLFGTPRQIRFGVRLEY